VTKFKVYRNVSELIDGTTSNGEWSEVGEYDGADHKAAVRAAIHAMPADRQAKASEETFGATPVSKWHEVSPNVTTETKVSFA